ncbi:hypothetical protein [Vibrio harveyi]|uniref:hypothetical protein n=1 Tax=Vibrio harveyi TaxID=669 RepID=UPI002480779D|nr:hypothetical protein [Vibrio harveyi]
MATNNLLSISLKLNEATQTIRVMPSNLMLCITRNGRWHLDPDISAPIQIVLAASTALMEHTYRYGEAFEVIKRINAHLPVFNDELVVSHLSHLNN